MGRCLPTQKTWTKSKVAASRTSVNQLKQILLNVCTWCVRPLPVEGPKFERLLPSPFVPGTSSFQANRWSVQRFWVSQTFCAGGKDSLTALPSCRCQNASAGWQNPWKENLTSAQRNLWELSWTEPNWEPNRYCACWDWSQAGRCTRRKATSKVLAWKKRQTSGPNSGHDGWCRMTSWSAHRESNEHHSPWTPGLLGP